MRVCAVNHRGLKEHRVIARATRTPRGSTDENQPDASYDCPVKEHEELRSGSQALGLPAMMTPERAWRSDTRETVDGIMSDETSPLVVVLMGSKSDWDVMRAIPELLTEFGVPHECRVLSAHRTPRQTTEYVSAAEGRGVEVVIAGAGGAAHLAGVAAGHTLLPVIGVPMESPALKGMDSLLSTVQMPAGIPVATMAIGRAGAINAALLAVSILAGKRPRLREKLSEYRAKQSESILQATVP